MCSCHFEPARLIQHGARGCRNGQPRGRQVVAVVYIGHGVAVGAILGGLAVQDDVHRGRRSAGSSHRAAAGPRTGSPPAEPSRIIRTGSRPSRAAASGACPRPAWPPAGRAGVGARSATIRSAKPYSSGSARRHHLARAVDVLHARHDVARVPVDGLARAPRTPPGSRAIRVSSEPIQNRKNASPAMSTTISTTVSTTSSRLTHAGLSRGRRASTAPIASSARDRGTGGAAGLPRAPRPPGPPVCGISAACLGVLRDRAQRVAHRGHPLVDELDEVHQQAQQRDHREDHDHAEHQDHRPVRDLVVSATATVSLPTAAGRARRPARRWSRRGRWSWCSAAQRRGVRLRLPQRRVDPRRLLADPLRQHDDRGHQRDHGDHDDEPDDQPDVPAGRSASWRSRQTPSDQSRTGFRLAFTEVSRAGTVLVRSAIDSTPPISASSVRRRRVSSGRSRAAGRPRSAR